MLVNAFTFTSNYHPHVFAIIKGVPPAAGPMLFGQIRNARFDSRRTPREAPRRPRGRTTADGPGHAVLPARPGPSAAEQVRRPVRGRRRYR